MSSSHTQDISVSVLLISLFSKEILVPKAMVADILSWDDELYLPAREHAKDWKIGNYLWKDKQVPLICIETLVDDKSVDAKMYKPKVAIIKSVQHISDDRHYAIRCDGFPRPLILGEQSLNNLAIELDQDWVNYAINIGSRELEILDFVQLENAIWASQEAYSHSA